MNDNRLAGLVNLASPRLGSKAVDASDEFFAPVHRMLADSEPIFIADKFDDHGKWMDGWETRRRRSGGSDWAMVQLSVVGEVHYIDLDTRHFTGNYPFAAALYGSNDDEITNYTDWRTLLPQTPLNGNSNNIFISADNAPLKWLWLNIYPDGGIARLRVYGLVHPDWSEVTDDREMELTSLVNGGRIIGYNDAHYGDVHALLTPGRGTTMGDGWETRRRRTLGNDWIVIALGHSCDIKKMEVDTAHFKGNYPDTCSVQGAFLPPNMAADDVLAKAESWAEILPSQKLQADNIHCYENEITADKPINYVRLNIYPDGGISRFRVFGTLAK
ncbi:MAG: allantoicase [Gammaproteobacteria bacterium WSBS_2016_MAG_OTU1]